MHSPFGIKYVISQPLCFWNKAKITLRQAFLAIYILYKSVLEHINDFWEIGYSGHVFF